MAQSITDVAAFILSRTGTITTMKLHKLAYYAQAAHIVAHNGAPHSPLKRSRGECGAPMCAENYNDSLH